MVLIVRSEKEFLTQRSPAPEPDRAEGTNTGHENGEAMASVGVRVQRPVRLVRVGRAGQDHSDRVRFKCPQKSGKRPPSKHQLLGLAL